jgi:hypothetical protein
MSIKSWLVGKIATALDAHYMRTSPDPYGAGTLVSSSGRHNGSGTLRSPGMDYTIYVASGGYVLEYHHYNPKTDSSEHRIHIISDSSDFGDQLSKIITLELLRQ